jgi:hypothetical protein
VAGILEVIVILELLHPRFPLDTQAEITIKGIKTHLLQFIRVTKLPCILVQSVKVLHLLVPLRALTKARPMPLQIISSHLRREFRPLGISTMRLNRLHLLQIIIQQVALEIVTKVELQLQAAVPFHHLNNQVGQAPLPIIKINLEALEVHLKRFLRRFIANTVHDCF